MIRINSKSFVPHTELEFSYSRASGPGGQKVNKSDTQVTLKWSIEKNSSLALSDKQRILEKLVNYINSRGELVISSQKYRSRDRNQADCISKFQDLLARALKRPKKRKKTRIPSKSKEQRLQQKRARGELKKTRKNKGDW